MDSPNCCQCSDIGRCSQRLLQWKNFKTPGQEAELWSRFLRWAVLSGQFAGGGVSRPGLDRLFYRELRITAWRAGTGTSCSFIQLRLVHQSQTDGAGLRERNFLGAVGPWSQAVCRPAEHPSHVLFTLGRTKCRVPGLTEKKLNQKPAWLVLWAAINSWGLAYAMGGHDPPTEGLDVLEGPSEGKLDKQAHPVIKPSGNMEITVWLL